MKRKWKIWIGVVVCLAVLGGAFAAYRATQKNIVTVQTGTTSRQDLVSLVTASGEIKPRNYINIGANAQGRLTEILVKEGDHVRKNQVVARVESIQAQADVAAQRAAVNSAMSDAAAAEDGVKVLDDSIRNAEASVARAKTELERAKLNFDRYDNLFKQKLISKQDWDQKRVDYEAQLAAVHEAETRVQQAKSQRAQGAAQLTSSQRRITQMRANLTRIDDVLARHDAVAPIDGVVTNLPVRVGETVVPGIQNSSASTIMTIADMSLITAEVKVDETDIVNVKLDQQAVIAIDAIPGRTFTGRVIEIGNTAILRSSGVAASQSAVSSQEAKDFKVVIALDNPPDEIRPGLSCNAKITTATRLNALTIPIQALTVRQKGDLEPQKKEAPTNAPVDAVAEKAKKKELQGVFVINGEKAEFREVQTGITGSTDIEVVKGLQQGDQIITGSYKVIRTLRNETRVKVDNKPPVSAESKG
ncbi:MAG: efflux RND transporter periplasmic adaptor subunit [Bryobacteraceae bacterium]